MAADAATAEPAPPPVVEIDPDAFRADPYPDLTRMRAEAPRACRSSARRSSPRAT